VTNDYEEFTLLMERDSAWIRENEPGTLVMEVFADETTGRVVVHEVYSDADAFIAHVENLMGGERMAEFARVFELKRLSFLTEIDDERVAALARQFKATEVVQISGFAR
jgi:quinol monooxygenase YgiN